MEDAVEITNRNIVKQRRLDGNPPVFNGARQ
jgi:hypothetical protein